MTYVRVIVVTYVRGCSRCISLAPPCRSIALASASGLSGFSGGTPVLVRRKIPP